MRVAGLLSKNQLDRIFLNIEELVDHNRSFTTQIKDAYEIALEQGDEDLLTVNVAKLFLQATPMLHAFQLYCVRQVGLLYIKRILVYFVTFRLRLAIVLYLRTLAAIQTRPRDLQPIGNEHFRLSFELR